MGKVLVVDDDPALLRALRIGLVALGHEVLVTRSGEEGLAEAARWAPEVVVLDLGLPGMDGLEVCHRLRQWSDVPVIVLSAAGAEESKVAALDGGADDFVTKPFGMAELEARVRVALRRRLAMMDESEPSRLEVGDLSVDLEARVVRLGGQPVDLTARELDFLAYLARHAGKVCTHRMVLEQVWGRGYATEVHYLRVYASRLRRKLGDDKGAILHTVPGVGYQLMDPAARG
ncbi:MAG: response regulator transcription factor [Actinomycetota bacterium]|nr:response regulator transcription factor [Actinomycetota bacterium]